MTPRLEVLGSGGALPTPRPGCSCRVWHPDHTMGRRVWETRNSDFRGWPPEAKETLTTRVYLPEQVAADFGRRLALREHFGSHVRGVGLVDGLSHEDLLEVAARHGRGFEFAYDGMVLEV